MLPQYLARPSTRLRRFEKVNKYIRNILLALLLLCMTSVTGIVGFMLIDGYTFREAFFMTIITLSTVGFGEVRVLSPEGQLFTSFLIIFNLGVFAYAISIITNFLVEGELRSFLKDYRMYKKIQQLKDHTIVCGFGRHGHQVCEELDKMGASFVVIEPDEAQFEDLRQSGYFFLQGDATADEILLEASIQAAKAVVITYSENALNVYTVLTARQLNPRLRIITRASDHKAEKKLLRAGADHVVLTEVIGGFYMATLINQPNVVEFFSIISNMGEVSIHFKEVEFTELKPAYRNKSIKDLSFRAHTGVNIIGVRQPDGHYDVNPKPEVIIKKGMTLVVLGDLNQIKAFKQQVMLEDLPPQENIKKRDSKREQRR